VRVRLARVIATVERRSLTCNCLRVPNIGGRGNLAESCLEGIGFALQPFKDEAYLFYIRTQRVPRCKHTPLRL
jgi:hypothetical protein